MIARATIGLPERARACQGDREGRPYNTRGRVTRATGYCTGDPRGRPGSPIVFLAIIQRPCISEGDWLSLLGITRFVTVTLPLPGVRPSVRISQGDMSPGAAPYTCMLQYI